ncbi:hypothetical protein MKY04_18180 [Lysinibacillus telephonicus]|uniref:hypothetical protein n=1 Tax=Lysinibacillus telephonicus TaxID=1714840 RepID=UPI0031FDD85B
MKSVTSNVDFTHNEEVIHGFIRIYTQTNGYSLHFTYKGIPVGITYDDDETTYTIVGQKNCELIDLLGAERFKTYRKYEDELKSLEKYNIVVADQVYGFFHTEISGVHILRIKMTDGTSLDGDGSTIFYEETRRSKSKSLHYLRSRVLEHYKQTGATPEPEFLKADETELYQSMKKWLEENSK